MMKIAVSSGDPAGIGPDICIKAFGQKKSYNFSPVIFGDKEILKTTTLYTEKIQSMVEKSK